MPDTLSSSAAAQSLSVLDLPLARLTVAEVLDHLFGTLARGQGGWLITANLDFLRRWDRDPTIRALYNLADVIVADGMPLLWAARLQGDQLPERVAGSSLVWLVAERAAREGRSIYFLGGDADVAERAARRLQTQWPGLTVAGTHSPKVASPPTANDVKAIAEAIGPVPPDFLLVALGSPKQEQVINALRAGLPTTWMIGVGASFSFVAGDLKRAPAWAQKLGLEWAHRMIQEPRRLAKRYLVHDIPFAASLFARTARERWRRRTRG